MRISSIVLDLDDTLYLEQDYVRSGIAAVGDWFARRTGCNGFAAAARQLWDAGQRRTLFDATLRHLQHAPDPALVQALVATYRQHDPTITLADDALAFLSTTHGRKLALVTDGIATVQRRKIEALRLDRFDFAPIVVTGELGQGFHKPHRRAFDLVAAMHDVPPAAIVYVADNPAKDFLAPRALGWRTVQIDRPNAVHPRTPPDRAYAAEAHITTFAELDATLERLADTPR